MLTLSDHREVWRGGERGENVASYLERNQISPNAGFICRFDFVIEMIEDDIVYIFVPSQNFS